MRYLFVLAMIAVVAAGCESKTRCEDNQLRTMFFRSPNPIPDTGCRYYVYPKGADRDLVDAIDTGVVKTVATYSGEYSLPVNIEATYMYFHHYDWVFELYPSKKKYIITDITFKPRKAKQYNGYECVNDLTMKINDVSTDYPGKDKYTTDGNYSINY